MELGYHPAITDRLFLELNRDNFSYLVCNKQFSPLKSGSFDLMDEDLLLNVLDTNPVFRQIFAKVSILLRGADFVLIPQEELSENSRTDIFRLSYALQSDEKLGSGFIGNTIEVVYRKPILLRVLLDHFPNPELQHELEVFCKCWFGKAVNQVSTDMYGSLSSGKLLLSIRSRGTIVFANAFDVQDIEDIFYFCMLSIEQLELDIERTNLYWSIEDPAFRFEDLQKRFAPYIGNVRPYLFDISSELDQHTFVSRHNGFKAVLQCAS